MQAASLNLRSYHFFPLRITFTSCHNTCAAPPIHLQPTYIVLYFSLSHSLCVLSRRPRVVDKFHLHIHNHIHTRYYIPHFLYETHSQLVFTAWREWNTLRSPNIAVTLLIFSDTLSTWGITMWRQVVGTAQGGSEGQYSYPLRTWCIRKKNLGGWSSWMITEWMWKGKYTTIKVGWTCTGGCNGLTARPIMFPTKWTPAVVALGIL